jgi:F-box protein 21
VSSLVQITVYAELIETRVEDRSVRYVAEENIDLIFPHFTELPQSLTAIAGKHFKRWDEVTRTFISNVKDEYPDD